MRHLLHRLRPALLTLSIVCLLLGGFLSVMILLIAWIRTPEALYVTGNQVGPRMVRGGESLGAISGWLRAELTPGVLMVLAGCLGVARLRERGESLTRL